MKFRLDGHAIYRRNARVIEMQNVTPDWPLNINCELHAAKEFVIKLSDV